MSEAAMIPANTNPELGYRDQWLALLDKNGVGRPTAFEVIAVPGIVVQKTRGEPVGSLELPECPGDVLMVNLSPVQGLRQFRNQRSFVSNMLHWDMTLMPRGTPSTWSWNSACDRLDLVILPDALGEECEVEIVDRFLFRDRELADICRRLCRKLDPLAGADRLHIESLAIEIASSLLREYSAGSLRPQILPSGGLPRGSARRVIEYIEANLGTLMTIRDLAAVTELSPHHFLRMFKETVGVTPHQYVLERRLDRARELLQRRTMKLAEIGLHVGFGSQSHFTTAFHRAFGVTPAKFGRIR